MAIDIWNILCSAAMQREMRYDLHSFNKRWRRDIAHRPLRVPGEPRRDRLRDLTRFGVVRLIRNEIAAHNDRFRPTPMDESERSSLIRGWSSQMDGQAYRLEDGKFEVFRPYGIAVLRQVAFESLAGFGIVNVGAKTGDSR